MKDNDTIYNNIFGESSENIIVNWFPNDVYYMIKISSGYYVKVSGVPPNKFHRFMMKLLLGWEITVIGGKNKNAK